MPLQKAPFTHRYLFRYLILFLILISFQNFSFAQKPLPRIKTADNFLIRTAETNFAYDIEVDKNGYVLIVGSNGFNSFNGNKLELIDSEYGIVNGGIYKGFDEKILLTGLDGSIAYVEKGSVKTFPIPDTLTKKVSRGYHSVYQTEDGTLHFAPINRGYFTLDTAGILSSVFDRTAGYHGFFVQQLPDGKWIHYSTVKSSDKGKDMSLYLVDKDQNVQFISTMTGDMAHYQTALVSHADSSMSISIGRKEIIRFKGTQLIDKYHVDHMIIGLFADSRGNLWIGTVDNGFYRITNFNFSAPECYWGGASAVVAEDAYGGLWFKSDSLSLGYLPPALTPHYAKQTGYPDIDNIHQIIKGENEFLVQNSVGEVFVLESDSLWQLNFPKILHKDGVRRSLNAFPIDYSYNSQDSTFWFGFTGFLMSWDREKWVRLELDPSLFQDFRVREIKEYDNGQMIGSTRKEVFTISNNKMTVISDICPSNITSLAVDHKKRVWLGSNDGIWILDSGKMSRPPNIPSHEKLVSMTSQRPGTSSINEVLAFQDEVWALSYEYGICRIKEDGAERLFDKGEVLGFSNHSIDPAGNLWFISTSTGNLIKTTKTNSDLSITNYGFEDLASRSGNMLTNLVVTDSFVYSGTSFGLFKEPIENLEQEKRIPRVVYSELRINAKPTTIQSNYDLSYNQNNIIITYDIISFRMARLELSYQMKGVDSTWIYNNYRHIQYTNLNPGIYEFHVRARTVAGEWSKPKTLTFHIASPYWETWWFWTIIVILFILLLYVWSLWRAKKIRYREREKSKIALEVAQLELRALKAQINPHFIFNSITSVMYYLSQNKMDEAESYLQRFSKLIRKVLESSDQNLVSIQEEVELMRHYIQLESERFSGEKIDLKTSFGSLDPEQVKIPPTLLQPYIENAIRHGLKLKNGERNIQIDFDLIEESIHVIITDNGIGRTKAIEQDTRINHKSFGMLISSRRIELLNKKNITHVQIEDLKNTEGEATGTRISFNIPFSKQALTA